MTTPTNGQQPEQPFMPEAHFAVQAQQEEIDHYREQEKKLRDHGVYLRAVVLQIQAEAAHRDSLLRGDIAQRDAEIDKLRKQLFVASQETTSDLPLGPMEPAIDNELDNQVADGEWSGVPANVRIDEPTLPTPETAKFDRGDGEDDHFPEPQAGIPVDQEWNDHIESADVNSKV